ncbi:MAG: hypothetical protein JJE19_05265, partial [Methanosarcinales archaeon]|nr:hypothetical protein [Methanosarcinales archaeon]
ATLCVQWNSTQEFGDITTITVKKGVINGTEETNVTIIQPSSIGKDPLCDEHELIIAPNESCYYRIEAYSNTTNGEQYRCYTNPIWMDVVNDTTSPVVTIITPVNGSIVSTPNVTLTGYATDDVGIVSVCYAQCYEKICGGSCDYPSNASTNVSFNWTVGLQEGENIITVTAYDAADNSGNASVVVTLFKPAIAIEAEKCELAKFEWDKLTVMGISTHNITIDSSDPAHTIFPMGIGDNPFTCSIPFNDTIDSDGIRTYTAYFNDTGTYMIKVTDIDAGVNDTVDITVSGAAFDTGNGTYPSIAGNHTGTITLNHTITVSTLYTYPCPGTGGHTEYAAISYSNGTEIAEAHWNGYIGDWHNISFNETFTLIENETYNYTMKTGSYPQIHHTDELEVASGTITCEEFVDANGKKYTNWIPAIRLE